MGIRPDDFYNMSFREFYAALFGMFPPDDKDSTFESDEDFFSADEKEILQNMMDRHK